MGALSLPQSVHVYAHFAAIPLQTDQEKIPEQLTALMERVNAATLPWGMGDPRLAPRTVHRVFGNGALQPFGGLKGQSFDPATGRG